jgi:hypothetical protein
MMKGKLHPKVAAVGVTGALVTVLNGAIVHFFPHFHATAPEVTLETAAILTLAGYLKRAVGTGF